MVIEKVAWTPLIGRKIPFARTRGKDVFYTIGGKIEPGESKVEALMREVLEEADVRLIPGTIYLRKCFEGPCHGYPEGTVLTMYCCDGVHKGKMTPSREIEDIVLFASADKHRTTDMGRTVLDWFYTQGLID